MKPQTSQNIRVANQKDIDAITQIEQKSFPAQTAYPKRQLAYLALKANSTCLIETQEALLRGFVIVVYRKGSLKGWLETIDVDPAFRGQGTGARLLKAAEDEMRKRGKTVAQLEVSKNNKAAINLYTKAGYAITQSLPSYYKFEHQGTKDAVRMTKKL